MSPDTLDTIVPANLTEYYCTYTHQSIMCLVRVNWHLGSRCGIVIREPIEFIGTSLEVAADALTPIERGRLIKTTKPYSDLTEEDREERLRVVREAREKPVKSLHKKDKSPKAIAQEKRKTLLNLPLSALEEVWSKHYGKS